MQIWALNRHENVLIKNETTSSLLKVDNHDSNDDKHCKEIMSTGTPDGHVTSAFGTFSAHVNTAFTRAIMK